MFVKFCGFTREKDLEVVPALEIVYAVGFIFHESSKRYISPDRACELGSIVHGTGIKKVGIFTGEDSDEILRSAEQAKLDILQIYNFKVLDHLGKYYPVFCSSRIKQDRDLEKLPDLNKQSYYLFDAFHEHEMGGTGKVFNWELLKTFKHIDRTIAAGGINMNNVKEIIKYNIYGIDLSSGIEVSPGIKSLEKMTSLSLKIKEVLNEQVS